MNYYFKIKKNNEYENFADILFADKEAKHYVKCRAYSPYFIDDNKDIYNSFKPNKIPHKDGSYFKLTLIFGLISLFMLAISIYCFIGADPNELLGLIAIPLTCLFFIIGFVMFFAFHIIEYTFVKSTDDLYIVYDKENNPCCIEIRKKKNRVLYKGNLYIVKGNKVKVTTKNRPIYLALLNMLPTCVLNIDGFNLEFEKSSFVYSLTPKIEYLQNGNSTLSIYCPRPIFNLERFEEGERVYFPKPQYVHFNKYIFTIDSNLKLSDIYYAARENNIIDYFVLTYAKLTNSGKKAKEELLKQVNNNIKLKEILKNIL